MRASCAVSHSYASDASTGEYSGQAPFLYDCRIEYHVPASALGRSDHFVLG